MKTDTDLARLSFRLAVGLLLAGYVLLAVIGFYLHDAFRAPAIHTQPAAYVDQCGKVRPDILDGVTIKGGKIRPKRGDVA